jgi:hypothetical protein
MRDGAEYSQAEVLEQRGFVLLAAASSEGACCMVQGNMRLPAILLVVFLPLASAMHGQTATHEASEVKPLPGMAERTAGMRHESGLLGLDYDARAGRIYLEVPLTADPAHTRSAEMIYVVSLPHGAGSNDLGLDRGQIGGWGGGGSGDLVYFERSGPKLLLVEPNERFRSSAKDAAQQASVRESFAESVLWGFKVEAQTADGASVLVDATNFFVRDARGVTEVLAAMKQGSYRFDESRSAPVPDRVKAFPKNIAVESIITLTTDAPPERGEYVQDVTPDPHAMTVHERQMFVALPEPGYVPRRFSPRSGYFPEGSYRDYTAPLGGDFERQFLVRHRLQKKDPNCTHACEAVTPIQYYVDRGAPEPIRSALVEGARWWDQAFQAAGWAPGTFRVDLLPEGADPMDVRYNIIQWVHRYTRGWSYGAFIADPRTGEILKGNVTLGSLRGRQDYLIAQALLAPYVAGKKQNPENDPALQMVLQRIRQLAAHETGHTLGLAHNFAASSFPHLPSETVSVMDYPHPWVTLKDGVPDLSQAYPSGIGIWDKVAIEYGYREFDRDGKRVEEPAALETILRDSEKTGLIYLTDEDARPLGAAEPQANLWDNGTDPAAELNRVLEVRQAALDRFGEDAIKPGTDLAQLEDTLVPLYLFHRYQTEAAVKEIGGLYYRYNVRGDGQAMPVLVPNDQQKAAIAAVLKTLSPEVLTLPERLLEILPPRPPGLAPTRESLPSETGVTFDPVAAAEAAADLTLRGMLDPQRASRIVQYHMRNPPSKTSLREMMESISAETARRIEGGHTLSSEVERAVESRGLEAMLGLAVNEQASIQVRAIARWHIDELLKQWTTEPPPSDSAEAIHRAGMIERVKEFERAPERFVPAKPVEAPPGMPIGDEDEW